jgi:hypothetical protein
MADNSVRSNTPDPTRYHANQSGMTGTMIPRSGADGQSLGFDPNQPQTVIVDPGVEGGGFILDLKAISSSRPQFNSEAKRSGVVNDVHSFYKGLSQQVPVLDEKTNYNEKELRVDEPLKPLNFLNSNDDSGEDMLAAPSLGFENNPTTKLADEIQNLLQVEMPRVQNAKLEFQTRKLQTEAAIAALSSTSNPQQLADQTNLLNALVGRVNRLSAASVEHKEMPDSIQTAFAKLQIPFFSGVKPERPLYEVYFEMAKLGTMSARYHAVIAGDACVALVYDTRFEDGFQYLPPNLGEEQISISVPKTKETYLCSSLGLHWSLGCLDVVILIRYKED